MLGGSPVDGSYGLCILLIVAIYLMCQCAVHFTTFRDACKQGTRWAMILNAINSIMSVSRVVFVCVKFVQNKKVSIVPNANSADSFDTMF